MRGRSNPPYFLKRIKAGSPVVPPPAMSITPASATMDRWGTGRSIQVAVGLSSAPLQTTTVTLGLSDPSVTASVNLLTFGPGLPTSANVTLTGTTYGPNNVTMTANPSNPGIMPQALLITRPNFALPVQSGLEFWFKADGGALKASGQQATANNDLIAQFFDMSAIGRSMLQANPTLQPKFQNNQQNGLPGVVFDGNDDFLDFADNLNLNDLSIYWIGRFLETPSAGSAFLHGNQPNFAINNYTGGIYWYNAPDIVSYNGPIFSQNTPVNVQLSRSGSNWQLIVNGQTRTMNYGYSTSGSIKGAGKSFSDFSNMMIHEIAIFSRSLSTAEQAQMNTYLSRWSI